MSSLPQIEPRFVCAVGRVDAANVPALDVRLLAAREDKSARARPRGVLVDGSGHSADELVVLTDAAIQTFAGRCPHLGDSRLVGPTRERASGLS